MFGRDTELARVERMLDRVAAEPSVLALEGTPGIGKSTLWREGVAGALRRGYRVLSTAPGEPDRALGFAGLGDLFDGLDPASLGGLPEFQRRALAQALMLEAPGDVALDPRALARAILTVLRQMGQREPLVVAIDDEQWLDPASAQALAFALTRLEREPIGVLLARRSGTSGDLWPELSRGFDGQGLTALVVEPLNLQAIDQLLNERLKRPISRPLLARIQAASGGNPLYALAIARELQTRPAHGTAERDLPIPGSLTDALAQRLGHLDRRTAQALLVIAAASQPTIALLSDVIEDFSLTDLDRAVELDLIELPDNRVQFTHPLLASTHYTSTPLAQRRELHRLLAEVVSDEEQRAYHLARGAEAPDRTIALTIEQAAGTATQRGAPLTAAALLEDAARLTPSDSGQARHSRTITAAEQYVNGGDIARARQLLEALLPELPHNPTRARALSTLAEARADDFELGVAFLKEALDDVGDHFRLRSRIETDLAGWLASQGRFSEGLAYSRAAVASAEQAEDHGMLALALVEQAEQEAFVSGRGVDWDSLRRAVELEDPRLRTPSSESPTGGLGKTLFWYDDFDAARPHLEQDSRSEEQLGLEFGVAVAEYHLMMLEWFSGNRDAAEGHRRVADRVFRDGGMDNFYAWVAWAEALFAGGRGELETARMKATEAVEIAYGNGDLLIAAMGEPLLAWAELWQGEPAAAHDRLKRVREPLLREGLGFLGSLTLGLWVVDIEALIACGRPEEAQPLVDDLLARAVRSGNPNAVAIAHRCQGLLLAARGDIAAAIDEMDAALTAHAERRLAPEVARTLLERGALQRRAKQKNAAKQSLEQALEIFEPMGAAMWSARARDELGRIGLRRPTVSQGLTPAQQRVAELVASGMSNRQVATTLYMSQRSVEAHLTKIYRELGVKSRSQLVAAMTAAGEDPSLALPPH